MIPAARQTYEQAFLRVLMHEIVHVWTLRVSEAHRLYKRNESRLRALHSKKRSLESLKSALSVRPEDPALVRDFYLHFREELLSWKREVCEEGFAQYLALLLADGAVVPDGGCGSDCVNSFEKALATFPLLVQAKGRFPLLDHVPFFEAYDKMCRIWKDAAYKLGPTIPKVLLGHGYSLDAIARMSTEQMLRAYEDACKARGLTPYFASRPETDAVFNFGTAALQLNHLRKKLGIV